MSNKSCCTNTGYCICQNCQTCLSKLPNVFVEIAIAIAIAIVPPPNVKQILLQLRIGGPAKTWIWTQECKSFSLFPSAERRIKGKTSSWKENTFIHIGKCICQNCQIVFEPKSEQVYLCSWAEDKRQYLKLEIKRIFPYPGQATVASSPRVVDVAATNSVASHL